MKFDVHVAVWCVVAAKYVHRSDNLDTLCIHWHEDLGLARMFRRIRIGDYHADHDLTACIAGTGDVKLFATDHPLITIQHGTGCYIGRVRGSNARLGHGEGRTNLTRQ